MERFSNIFILAFLTCLLSCNSKQTPSFNKEIIQSISKEDKNFPSRFSNLIFFCKCNDDNVLPLNIQELRDIYTNQYASKDYSTFLTNLLNQKIAIQCNNQDKRFTINKEVEIRYKKMDINEFINFYCIETSNNLFQLKNNIVKEQKNSILYYLFINNYLISFDDYSGVYKIRKTI